MAGGQVPIAGWVYVLTNPGLPGVVKIGLTTRDVSLRSAELLREYGTVYPFTVASRHAVSDCVAVEAAAHRLLDACRLPASELFRCNLAAAQKAVLEAARGALNAPWWRRLWRHICRRSRPVTRRNPGLRYGRRGPFETLFIGGVALAVAVPIVLFKPVLPTWLPIGVIRLAVLLEQIKH